MKLTKSKLKQLIKEELISILNEIKIGDTVEHKTEDRGKGLVVALGSWSKKGQISVKWPRGMQTHHEDALVRAGE